MIALKDVTKETAVEGVTVLIEKRQEQTTKAGKPYLSLVVRDKSVSMNAKLWDYSEARHGKLSEGSTVNIWATVDEFAGTLQLNIKDVGEALADATEFYKRTRFDVEEMWGDLVKLVGTFEEPLTKFVCEELLLKHEAFIYAFKKAPAAKSVHNAWYGGLLEHVHSLTTIADPIIKHYQTRYLEKISRDKVMFGLIMHDAGKIIEYDYEKPSFDMTNVGIFTNHLVLGPAWVYEKANLFMNTFLQTHGNVEKFKIERAHLMHVLAAHHGQIAWGSPVVPASIEAVIVHHLDNLDAKVLHALEHVEGKASTIKGFSERSRIEGTPFYQYTI